MKKLKLNKSKVTIGADPEFFLEQNGKLKSAIDRIGGMKSDPRPLSRTGYYVQEDNVAVEFNIPPAKTLSEFVDSIQWSVKEIERELSDFNLKPSLVASAFFPLPELNHPRAKEFGCDPDFNAWDGGQRNPKPVAASPRLRSCGGHVHVGYPQNAGVDKLRLIQLMDLYLGVPSVLMDHDFNRRQLYGKAGAFRPQPHGVEYRTLSNFWLKDERYTSWVYEQTHRAIDKLIEFGESDGKPDEYSKFMESFDLKDQIQEAINNGNVEIAHNIIGTHGLSLVV